MPIFSIVALIFLVGGVFMHAIIPILTETTLQVERGGIGCVGYGKDVGVYRVFVDSVGMPLGGGDGAAL